ncbi:MAG: YncE family protein [Candidatus Tyrphobacter sp.]
MPIIALPPQRVGPPAGFDYVTVDAVRHRVYAAHGRAQKLLVVDADTGAVLRQVTVGHVAGSAVDPTNGHVYTGNGDDDSLSEVDPVAGRVLRTVKVQGHVDAIAYDPAFHRIYAGEDDGTRVFVIDSRTFKEIAVIPLPGHKPEYLAIDPVTHAVYQNISDANPHVSAIAVIDPHRLRVVRTIPTPDLQMDHPLQFDPVHRVLLVAGENNWLDVYSLAGRRLYHMAYPHRVDQCGYDASRGWLACAGDVITLVAFDGHGPPHILAQTGHIQGVHTCGIDPANGTIFAVWSNPRGSFVGRFVYRP